MEIMCKVSGCDRQVRSRGFCSAHYKRDLRGQPLDKPIRQPSAPKGQRSDFSERICETKGCNNLGIPDGKGYRHPLCYECDRGVNREKDPKTHGVNGYMRFGCKCDICCLAYTEFRKNECATRLDLISQIKLEAGCMDCGYAEYACVLQFDHRPDEIKLFGIGGNQTSTMKRLFAEIAKCDVVCANCHQIRTSTRRGHNMRPYGFWEEKNE